MPWTDQPEPRPQRSEDELFEVVRRRAAAIRRRRRTAVSAALGGVAAVLVIAAGLARAGDDPSSTELHVVGPAPTTSTAIIVVAPPPGPLPTTTVAAPTTTARPATTVPPTTRTTAAPRTTTTAPPAPTTTSSTVPPPLRRCDPADVVVTATPDRTTYAVGAPVNVLVAALNRSSSACQPIDPMLEFQDSAGRSLGGMGVADIFTMGMEGQPPPSWDPGETLSTTMGGAAPYCGEAAAMAPCPPGAYTATAVFGPFRSSPATFTIV